MGCTSSKEPKSGARETKSENAAKRASVTYRQELDDDYLEMIKAKLPPQTKVFIIKLLRLENIAVETDRLGTYVEFSTTPTEIISENQWQV